MNKLILYIFSFFAAICLLIVTTLPLLPQKILLSGVFFVIFSYVLYFKNFELFIIFTLLLCFDFADLVPKIKLIHTYDLLFPLLLLSAVDVLISKWRGNSEVIKRNKVVNFFSRMFFIFLPVLIFCAVFMAYLRENQGLLDGLRGGRRFLFLLFFYVIINKRFSVAKFGNYLINLSIVLCILNLVQFFTHGRCHIFYVEILHRAGSERFFGGQPIVLTGIFFLVGRYIRSRKVIDLLLFLFVVFSYAFVAKTRMIVFGIFMSFIIISIVRKVFNVRIFFGSILLLIIGLFVCFNIPNVSFNKILPVKIYNETISEISYSRGNYLTRVDALKYFYEHWKDQPFLGSGLYSSEYKQCPETKGVKYGYFLSDLGWFSILYNFGFFGLLWALIFIVFTTKNAIKNKFYEMEIYMYFVISTCFTFNFFLLNNIIFVLALFSGVFVKFLNEM